MITVRDSITEHWAAALFTLTNAMKNEIEGFNIDFIDMYGLNDTEPGVDHKTHGGPNGFFLNKAEQYPAL